MIAAWLLRVTFSQFILTFDLVPDAPPTSASGDEEADDDDDDYNPDELTILMLQSIQFSRLLSGFQVSHNEDTNILDRAAADPEKPPKTELIPSR